MLVNVSLTMRSSLFQVGSSGHHIDGRSRLMTIWWEHQVSLITEAGSQGELERDIQLVTYNFESVWLTFRDCNCPVSSPFTLYVVWANQLKKDPSS